MVKPKTRGTEISDGKYMETDPRCPTNLSQQRKLVGLHNAAQTEICDHDVGIRSFRAEEEVFGF